MIRLCHCRSGCLSLIVADDDVVATPDGDALVEHVVEPYPAEQLALELAGAS